MLPISNITSNITQHNFSWSRGSIYIYDMCVCLCVFTQSPKYYLSCLCRQLFQATLSQTSVSAFSVSDCTLVLMFAALLGRGYQHCHTDLSPVTLILAIELSIFVALLWWGCPLTGWNTLSAVVHLLNLHDLVVSEVPGHSPTTVGHTDPSTLFAIFTIVWTVRSTWSGVAWCGNRLCFILSPSTGLLLQLSGCGIAHTLIQ